MEESSTSSSSLILSAEDLRAIVRSLSNSKQSLYSASSENFGYVIAASVVALLPKTKIRTADFESKSKAKSAVARMRDHALASEILVSMEKDLRDAVLGLGTHTLKFPDARSPIGGFIADRKAAVDTHGIGISSSTVRAARSMSWSGGAKHMAFGKFLTATFLVDFKPVTVFDVLVNRKHPLHDRMLAVFTGGGKDTLRTVAWEIKRRLGIADDDWSAVPDVVPAGQKSLLMPVEGGYVTVTPSCNLVVGTELASRLEKRKYTKGAGVVPVRTVAAGLPQPQNIGLLAIDVRGFFPLMLAQPMLPKDDRAALMKWKARRGNLKWESRDISFSSVNAFMSALADSRNNAAGISAQRRAARRIVEDVLEPVRILSRLYDEDEISAEGDSLIERLAGAGNRVSSEECDAIVEELLVCIRSRLGSARISNGSSSVPFNVDDAVISYMRRISRDVVREYAR